MNSSLSVSFQSGGADSAAPWVHLEQEYKKEYLDQTSIADVYGMLSYASTGKSAQGYAKKACTYVTLVGDSKIIVDLDFYVWPSSMDLLYNLKADLGEISDPEVLDLDRSFDVVFNGTHTEILPYSFDGTLTPQMPFIRPTGERIADMTPDISGDTVTFPEDIYCVLRAVGRVSGYKHTVTMEIDKTVDGKEYKIENFQNTIVASWVNSEGVESTDSITLDIPDCVTALLEECADGTLSGSKSCVNESCGNDPVFVVYYNTCDGQPVLQRWEKNE